MKRSQSWRAATTVWTRAGTVALVAVCLGLPTAAGARTTGRAERPALVHGDDGSARLPRSCDGRPGTIIGTPGDDVLRGTDGPDVIIGGGGADRIEGLGGDDRICGGVGADHLLGGAGDDRMFGQLDAPLDEADQMDSDELTGGPGDDYLVGGFDPVKKDYADALLYNDATGGVTIDLRAGRATGPGVGTDSIGGLRHTLAVWGSPYADRIVGTPHADFVNGQGGRDTILLGGGDDVIGRGSRFRAPLADRAADTLQLGPGDDFYSSDTGGDRVFGQEGDDTMEGSFEFATDDYNGYGGPGDDELFVATSRPAPTAAFGGGGSDYLTVFPDSLSLEHPRLDVNVPRGRWSLREAGLQQPALLAGRFGGFERYELGGYDGGNFFTGSSKAENLGASGLFTGEMLHAMMGGGDDVVFGGSDDDYIDGGPGRDTINGYDGTDRCLNAEKVRNCERSDRD